MVKNVPAFQMLVWNINVSNSQLHPSEHAAWSASDGCVADTTCGLGFVSSAHESLPDASRLKEDGEDGFNLVSLANLVFLANYLTERAHQPDVTQIFTRHQDFHLTFIILIRNEEVKKTKRDSEHEKSRCLSGSPEIRSLRSL